MKVGDLVIGIGDPQDRIGLVVERHPCIGTHWGMVEVFWGHLDPGTLQIPRNIYPEKGLEVINESR